MEEHSLRTSTPIGDTGQPTVPMNSSGPDLGEEVGGFSFLGLPTPVCPGPGMAK